MKATTLLAMAIGLFWAATAVSGTIYTWTDSDGVQRFSNSPPAGVEDYQRIDDSQPVRPAGGDADNKRRTSYDTMVERALQETRRKKQERKAQEAARIAKEKRLAQERRQAENKVERARLLKQIEAIKNRAVSPTYPMGMKQGQIDKIQKEIDALDKAPDDAASPKQEKPAESGSGY
jgi:hypothetical protein